MGDPYITLCVDEYGWNCVQCSFPDSGEKPWPVSQRDSVYV